MACHAPCIYKRDAARLERRVEILESGLGLEKLKQAVEVEKRGRLNAVNDRDRLKQRLEEREEAVRKLKETI